MNFLKTINTKFLGRVSMAEETETQYTVYTQSLEHLSSYDDTLDMILLLFAQFSVMYRDAVELLPNTLLKKEVLIKSEGRDSSFPYTQEKMVFHRIKRYERLQSLIFKCLAKKQMFSVGFYYSKLGYGVFFVSISPKLLEKGFLPDPWIMPLPELPRIRK